MDMEGAGWAGRTQQRFREIQADAVDKCLLDLPLLVSQRPSLGPFSPVSSAFLSFFLSFFPYLFSFWMICPLVKVGC